jgi:hypothetical protein
MAKRRSDQATPLMARTHALLEALEEELFESESMRRRDAMSELEDILAHRHRSPSPRREEAA